MTDQSIAPGVIDICVRNSWQKTHPAELKIVLCQLGFFQQLGHTHDFALTAAERMLSSCPAVTVQSAATDHQIPSRCRFPVNVIASPVTIEVSLKLPSLSNP